MKKIIQIISIDDHHIHNEGIKAMLQSVDDIHLAGTGRTGDEMFQLLKTHDVDVILLDIELPGSISKDGLELARELRSKNSPYRDVKIICLSGNARSYVLRELFGDIQIEGYLDKNVTNKEEIVQSIRYVMSDNYSSPCSSPTTIKRIQRIVADETCSGKGLETLTPRELDIVGYIAEGKSNAEIANLLSKSNKGKIESKTVDNHRTHIYSKLDCKNPGQVAKIYYDYKRLSTDNPDDLPNFQK